MKHQESRGSSELTEWQRNAEIVESTATCRCGHTLDKHASEGCTAKGCDCAQILTAALEAEVVAIDDL